MDVPLSFSDAETQLKLLTSQTTNFAFSDDEITQALNFAWQDTYVGDTVTDTSITLSSGVWEYNVPSSMDVVREIWYRPVVGKPLKLITRDLYKVVNGVIQFDYLAWHWLDNPFQLTIRGFHKLTTDEDLPSIEMVNYVLYLAAENLINTLIYRKTFQFLRTDITMADIAKAQQLMSANVLRYKQGILREFETT